MDRAAYIIDEDSVLQTGMLMLYYNGASILLDINVQPSSVRFSSDGNYLYALKCHDTCLLYTSKPYKNKSGYAYGEQKA